MTRYIATLTSLFFCSALQLRISGRLRKCCWCQNMKAQWAVRETAQTSTTQTVICRVRHGPPDTQHQQRRQHSHKKNAARRITGEQKVGEPGAKNPDVDARLQ